MEECTNAVLSEEYEDYLVEYFGDVAYLEDIFPNDCFQVISNRFAAAYSKNKSREGNRFGSIYVLPHCYGLLSSTEMLERTGIARVQRRPALGLYGQRVMVGFIDTGAGVRNYEIIWEQRQSDVK